MVRLDEVFKHVTSSEVIPDEEIARALEDGARLMSENVSNESIATALHEKRGDAVFSIDREEFEELLCFACRVESNNRLWRDMAMSAQEERNRLRAEIHVVKDGAKMVDHKRCAGDRHAAGLWKWPRLHPNPSSRISYGKINGHYSDCNHNLGQLSKMRAVVLDCGCQRCVLCFNPTEHAR
jgi:hypothetical protein